MTPKPPVARPGVFLFLLLCAGPFDDWSDAQAFARKFGGSKVARERAQAASRLAVGMDGKHDREAAAMLVALLAAELARPAEDEISGDVLFAVEASLRKAAKKEAVEALVGQAKSHANARVRFHVIRALGSETAVSFLEDREPRLVIAAADALAAQPKEGTLEAVLKALAAKETPWEAKLSLVRAVRKIGKPDASVEGLIGALEAATGRVKVDLIDLLGQFVGVKEPKSDDPGWWRTTWTDKKAGREPGKDLATVVEPTEFFGLKARSTRIVFILDRTGSMVDPCSFNNVESAPAPKTGPEKLDAAESAARKQAEAIFRKWATTKVTKKIEGLKQHFSRTLFNLDARVHFTVVWYEEKDRPWRNELVPATWANKLDCLKELDKLTPEGFTNIWGAIETAWRFTDASKKHRLDPRANPAVAIDGVDTFFLMTDGNHNVGRYVGNGSPLGPDTEPFIAELKKVHVVRKTAIHVVALGDLDAGGDPLTRDSLNFLARIANETDGEFRHVGQ